MVCPKCGAYIQSGLRFVACSNCGAMFDSEDRAFVEAQSKGFGPNYKHNTEQKTRGETTSTHNNTYANSFYRYKPPISNYQPPKSNYQTSNSNYQPPKSNHQTSNSNYQPPKSNYQTTNQRKNVRSNPYNRNVPMSYDKRSFKKPAEYRNLVLYFFLMLFTFGIYFLYQCYRLTKLSNEDESMTTRSPGLQIVLFLILPYVYWIYWAYQTGLRIENILRTRTGKNASVAAPSLILSFFGLGVIAMLIMQDKVNKYVGGITGSNMDADGFAKCKECGIYFPNDVTECPNCGKPYNKRFYENKYVKAILIIAVAALFITIVSSVALGIINEKTESYMYDSFDNYGYSDYYDYNFSFINDLIV